MTVKAGVIPYESVESSSHAREVTQNFRNRGRAVFTIQENDTDNEVVESAPKKDGNKCALCDRQHNTDVCNQFAKRTVHKRWQIIRSKGRCF